MTRAETHSKPERQRCDEVADVDCALELDEDAGDHVLNQLLRAEADRQAEYAGTGEQRCDVDAQK